MKRTKILSIVLALALIFTMIPAGALVAGAEEVSPEAVKTLSISDFEVNETSISKSYDGNDTSQIELTIKPSSLVSGKDKVKVQVTNAKYDNKNVGENKKITGKVALVKIDNNNDDTAYYKLADNFPEELSDKGIIVAELSGEIQFQDGLNVSKSTPPTLLDFKVAMDKALFNTDHENNLRYADYRTDGWDEFYAMNIAKWFSTCDGFISWLLNSIGNIYEEQVVLFDEAMAEYKRVKNGGNPDEASQELKDRVHELKDGMGFSYTSVVPNFDLDALIDSNDTSAMYQFRLFACNSPIVHPSAYGGFGAGAAYESVGTSEVEGVSNYLKTITETTEFEFSGSSSIVKGMVPVLFNTEKEPLNNYLWSYQDSDDREIPVDFSVLYLKYTKTDDKGFSDIDNHWAKEAITDLSAIGVVNGTSGDKFSPNDSITRGMLITLLYRVEYEPAVEIKNTFTDVNSSRYYAKAVQWGKDNGIINGKTSTKFAPDDSVTREEIAAILYRYADYKSRETNEQDNLDKFTDKDKISNYAVTAMKWAVAELYIKGRTETTLAPKGTSTRAEVVTILHRFLTM